MAKINDLVTFVLVLAALVTPMLAKVQLLTRYGQRKCVMSHQLLEKLRCVMVVFDH